MTGRRIEAKGPAREWLEAFPLGNGRMGAMCWGGHPTRIDLNEETVWSGNPASQAAHRRRDAGEAASLIAAARAAVLNGRTNDAEDALRAAQAGHAQAFLPVGSVLIETGANDTGPVERQLSLAEAVCTQSTGGIGSETFVSAPHDVLVHRVTGLAPGTEPIFTFDSPLLEVSREESDGELLRELRAPVDVAPGHEPDLPGAIWPDDGEESVTVVVCVETHHAGDELLVVVAIETTAPGAGETHFASVPEVIHRARAKARAGLAEPYESLRAAHVAAHEELFGRVELVSGAGARLEETARRLDRARGDRQATALADPDLVPLLFDYGRYLLIASSREPGRLPATLQGLWNAEMRPPWNSAYTVNINTQMNYWAAEPTNLPELTTPLFHLIGAMARSGEDTARRLGTSGWAAHHNSDAWGHSDAVGEGHGDPKWAFWPMAGVWLARHLSDHVAFGAAPLDFDGSTADPLRRGAAEFVLGWLVDLPGGQLGTAPSTSPENTYVDASGRTAAVGCTSTMDLALTREILGSVSRKTDELGNRARAALDRLPELSDRVTPEGVWEWDRPVTEVDPQHRHLSHLYPLFPGQEADEEFERAAAASLDRRGADSTGWSLAWKMALWSRLRRADRVDDLIELFFRDARRQDGQWAGGLYPNLFAAHPPFQIDGNLGFTAALAEGLLQSHRGEIELLPALPAALTTGAVRGLVARPGVIVDIRWSNSQLETARLRARPGHDGAMRVRWRNRVVGVAVTAARATTITTGTFLADPQSAAGEK